MIGGYEKATCARHCPRFANLRNPRPSLLFFSRTFPVYLTLAKFLKDRAGESVEDVSRFLDHSSLAVTSVYLRRLEGQQDTSWGKVAEAIGV